MNVSASTCSCCGQLLPVRGLRVDLNSNRLIYEQRVKRVAPQLAEFLAALIQRDGKPIDKERLGVRIWGLDRVPLTYLNVLSVYTSRARDVVQPLGFDIFSTGRGADGTLTLARSEMMRG